ncbi:hypothetical protein [Myroides fluvii]|uniref:hypothetical protein n=1 Tax=Myroides fluvii TaxID=2572594 RepID=UPI00131D75F7|nr:hypothetical protein [Myroides fluvii]
MSTKAIEDLQQIKAIMERSTKFLSLSGWSGIWVGICGLLASGILYRWSVDFNYTEDSNYNAFNLLALALITLVVALAGGLYFTIQKTKKQGATFFNKVTKRLLLRFSFPLVIGGILCIIFYTKFLLPLTLPSTILFYGLALYAIQEDTVKEIKTMALLEILLGLLAFYFVDYSLLFWALGFGVIHMLYGIILWNKYDKELK